MGLSPMIAQCLIYGDSFKNSCVSVVIPEEAWVMKWATDNNVQGDFAAVCQNAELKKVVSADMLRLAVANKLSSLEKPKGLHISSELFSIENDTLTPTFKLKRH